MGNPPDTKTKVILALAMHMEGFTHDHRVPKPDTDDLYMEAVAQSPRNHAVLALTQVYENLTVRNMYANPDDLLEQFDRLIQNDRMNPEAEEIRVKISVARQEVRRLLSQFSEPRPRVVVNPGCHDSHLTVGEIEPHLRTCGIYQRSHRLVRVISSDHLKSHVLGHVVARPVIDEHDVDSLAPALAAQIDFRVLKIRRDKKGNEFQVSEKSAPPTPIVRQVLRLNRYPGVPVLAGIVDGPFIRADGSICNQRGFDHQTGWFLSGHVDGLDVPNKPTDVDAIGSIELLMRITGQFPFKNTRQHAGWIAALLTLVARPSIDGPVPAFLLTSNNKGTGKTLLIHLLHTIAFGRQAADNVPPQGDDTGREWQQTLFSFARAGVPFVWFDELEAGSSAGNPTLNKYLTSRTAQERRFHTQDQQECPWNGVIFLSGNSLGIASDCARRIVPIVLETMELDPHTRKPEQFEIPDILQYARDDRAALLTAAFTILRWQIQNGKQTPDGLSGFASFEAWSKLVRDAVARLIHDANPEIPLADVDITRHDDFVVSRDASELETIMEGFRRYQAVKGHDDHGRPVPWTVAELFTDMAAYDNHTTDWHKILCERFDPTARQHAFAVSVGSVLNKFKSRPCDGHFIEKSMSRMKQTQYRIMPVVG